MAARPLRPTLFPYTTLFRSRSGGTLGLLGLLTDYFFEQFGPVTCKRGDICSGAGDSAQKLDFGVEEDRKSTRLNSSHLGISYAVFCLKKKNIKVHTRV